MTDEELEKLARERLFAADVDDEVELEKLFDPKRGEPLIALLREVRDATARECAELCEQAASQREAMFHSSHGDLKEMNRAKSQQSAYLAANIRGNYNLYPTPTPRDAGEREEP